MKMKMILKIIDSPMGEISICLKYYSFIRELYCNIEFYLTEILFEMHIEKILN